MLDDQDDPNNIESEHQLLSVMKDAFEVIKQTGRGHDFLSLMKSISTGTLDPKHIALHLLLDIGNFLSAETLMNVRYSDVTLDFLGSSSYR